MSAIDLNADVAEGTGIEALLTPHCTSWNLSCGFHAGSKEDIDLALALAKTHHIQVGAHPGHPDRSAFGRFPHPITRKQLCDLLECQVGALEMQAHLAGLSLNHLKMHGALYHQTCSDPELAEEVATFGRNRRLLIFGLPGSVLEQSCSGLVPFVSEGFVDRVIGPDGKLLPRDQPGAVIHDPAQATAQALYLARSGLYRTLCTHGDSPGAVPLLAKVKIALIADGYQLKAPGKD